MKMNKSVILSILGIISLVIITVGVSYAFFSYVKEGTTENSIETGTITFLYTEVSEIGKGIRIRDAYPVSDTIGKVQVGEGNVFDFKITSTTPNSSSIPYEVTARKKSTSTLDEDVVKLYLTKVNGEIEEEILLDKYSDLRQTERVDSSRYIEKTIYNGKVPANSSNYEENFRLRMWIDEDTDFSPIKGENGEDIYPYNNKEFTITVNVYANGRVLTEEDKKEKYNEEILNGTDPVLTDNLIPVTIIEDGTVRKADTTSKWYSYQEKNWANAVVLKDSSVSYENNEVIPEENIESYFVWIPKYSYQLWDLGDYNNLMFGDSNKVYPIQIRFGLANTEDSIEGECTTPNISGETGNCKMGNYMTHPAFQAFDTNGIWVGKFETGYDGATNSNSAMVKSGDSSKIIIKPNVYSWRYMTVGNAFEASYNYLRSEESHMMKNTEWGAVAYLTNSNYGRCNNGVCNEIGVNNNSNYITGYAGTELPTLGYNDGKSIEGNRVEATAVKIDGTYTVNYLNSRSNLVSTTGNKSGIYDMSGGAREYVMGYAVNASQTGGKSDITSIYSDFFTNSSWDKYYDKYTSTANRSYNNRILGDATGEMGPFIYKDYLYLSSWHNDYASFVGSGSPWFIRGDYFASGFTAGVFAFRDYSGSFEGDCSYRIVLAPNH